MSMLESLGVQPLARNSRHRQKTAAAMPRREALPFSLRAADETAAVSLIMSATSSTIFDGFVKSNFSPPPPQPSPVKGREIGTFYRFVIFVIIFLPAVWGRGVHMAVTAWFPPGIPRPMAS